MITDIVQKAGVAKGTFYYYFPTKEAILEAICTRWATGLATAFELESRQHNALAKLQAFTERMILPGQFDALWDKLWEEKQFDLVYKIWQQQLETTFNPLLTGMIRQGTRKEACMSTFRRKPSLFSGVR